MKKKLLKVVNTQDAENKISSSFVVEANALKDQGEGKILFTKPIPLTDTSEQWNGTKYDVKTMDISGWNLLLTADHIDKIQNILGKVIGLKKVGNNRVTIDGIEFAVKRNPLSDFAYHMMLDGMLTDFSIETVGPWPNDDGIYENSKLVGCSVVVQGNNKQAHVNEIALDTIKRGKENGLDVASFANAMKLPIDKENQVSDNNVDMKFKTVQNSRGFAIVFKYKNSANAEVEVTLQPKQSIEVIDNDANKEVENQITAAEEPKADAAENKGGDQPQGAGHESGEEKAVSSKEIADIVTNALKPLQEKIEKFEKGEFDNNVQEPQFTRVNSSAVSNQLGGLDWKERHNEQVLQAWNWLKAGNSDAARKLNEINKFNFEAMQKAGKVPSRNPVTKNAITIADFGNFVISPELLTEIEGFRSNFKAFLGKFDFKDTLSLDMAWLSRNGDINMQEVEFCDDDDDGNLKPISEYSATINQSRLNEIAAVTPVCNASTRFLAADLLGDVAEGYRNDWDRKKAQLVVARLQQAVNSTGKTVHYNTGSAGLGANVNALQSFIAVGGQMQQDVMGGFFVLSNASYWELMSRQAAAGINTDTGFKIFTQGPDGTALMFGAPYTIAPNELLPKLGSNETRTFIVGGVSVVITSAVFFVDPSTFTGRTSGGLQYDLSTEAAYEVNGEVRSSFQRNELVLRGSGFRGGAVKDPDQVVGLEAVNLS